MVSSEATAPGPKARQDRERVPGHADSTAAAEKTRPEQPAPQGLRRDASPDPLCRTDRYRLVTPFSLRL